MYSLYIAARTICLQSVLNVPKVTQLRITNSVNSVIVFTSVVISCVEQMPFLGYRLNTRITSQNFLQFTDGMQNARIAHIECNVWCVQWSQTRN
jgi:Flp pilus assembly protein protease CpaA